MIKKFEEFINENFDKNSIEQESKILANKLKRDINYIADFVDGAMETMDIPNKKGIYNTEVDMDIYGKKYTVCITYNVLTQDKYVLNKFDVVDDKGVRVSNKWLDITEDDYSWLFAIYGSDDHDDYDDYDD
jgi:hypothetical protein